MTQPAGKSLHGKAVLITGAAKRLGRASALALAEAGADVAITFNNSDREAQHSVIDISSFGVKAVALQIAVNCVAPGMIDLGEKAAAPFMKKMAAQTPMKRNGTGEEVAQAVLFFATAPHFITGQILTVDGGLGL